MRIFKRFLVVIALMIFTSSSAFAATNVYKDAYTTEDSSGNWTLQNGGMTLHSGNISATNGTVTSRSPLTIIASTANTVGTVTALKTGYTFIIKPTSGGGPNAAGPWELTLPAAATGLTYRVVTATGTVVKIARLGTSTDGIYFGSLNAQGTCSTITSPASTGSTVALIGSSNSWFVASMSVGGATGPNAAWTAGNS